MNGIWFFVGCLVISPLLLLPYQKQINEYNQFIKPSKPQQKKLYFGEVLTVIIGMFLSVWGAGITYSENKVVNALNNFNDDKQMVIGYLGGSYLRHTEGYGEVCANLGPPVCPKNGTVRQIFEIVLVPCFHNAVILSGKSGLRKFSTLRCS